MSRLGESIGWNWLIYNPLHFWHFHEQALANAPGVANSLVSTFPDAKTVIDIGAGTGMYAAAMLQRGIRAVACEHNKRGRSIAIKHGVDCRPFDLTVDPPVDTKGLAFDLAFCFEVAEHLPPTLGDRLIGLLCSLAPSVVFSAAHPGQGGTGHINEQPKDYWILRFEEHGFGYNEELSRNFLSSLESEKVQAPWFAENSMVFLSRAKS